MELTIKKTNAIAAYKTATNDTKKTLELLFGKDVLSQKITERISDFNDICAEDGVDPDNYKVTDGMSDEDKFAIYAKKIRLICKVLNEGVKLDYGNRSQKKWYPWFKWDGAGFGFSFSYCYCDYTTACVGSRLCSQELSDFAGKTFQREYNEYLNAQ